MNECEYVVSRYNYELEYSDSSDGYIFNCLSGALIKVPKIYAELLSSNKGSDKVLSLSTGLESHRIFRELRDQGFIKKKGVNELLEVKKRYENPEVSQIFSLTIAPTFNCNLNCSYCYQGNASGQISKEILDKILNVIEQELRSEKYLTLQIQWYGGEPLLALKQIIYLTEKILEITDKYKVKYKANLITNGTLIDEAIVDTLHLVKITHAQITLDGPFEIHNQSRFYQDNSGSFKDVLNAILILSKHIDLSIRINVDKNSIKHTFSLLETLSQKLNFNQCKKVLPYIAMIGPYTETCKDTIKTAVNKNIFYSQVLDFQEKVLQLIPNLTVQEVFEFPKPRSRSCGALNPGSICIAPNGQVFKCGLEMHDPDLGGDNIGGIYKEHINYRKWIEYDPMKNETCLQCIFLPICMGGCVKFNFEQDHYFSNDACSHWGNHLEDILKRIIKVKAGNI